MYLVIPITFALILFLLFASARSAIKTMIVILAISFSVVGALWAVYALDYNVSIAVWVGIVASPVSTPRPACSCCCIST